MSELVRIIISLLMTMAVLCLFGCGGGGSSEVTPDPVSVNAGTDQALDEKTSFTLKGVATPEGGVFTWSQIGGPLLTGFPVEGAEHIITAPEVKLDTTLIFRLEYRTSNSTTITDTVNILVRSNNQLPIVAIEQTAPTTLPSNYGDTITLSSAKSSDPDPDGELVTYLWTQTLGQTLAITDFTQAELSFTHPLLEVDQLVQFSLTITDDEGGSQTNTFDLVLTKTSQLIAVNAGATQTANEFSTVTLDATNSQVLTDSFTCQWLQTSGTNMSLTAGTQCITNFTIPDIDVAEQLVFQVTVTDELNRSETGTTRVNIKPLSFGLLNDTGVAKCFDDSSETDCKNDNFPGQDAELGRDTIAEHLDKVGDGSLAFDFTKLDEFADELPDSATEFSCVRDNLTGLIWEVKQASTGTLPSTALREGQNHYTWFYTGDGNGGVEGIAGDANSSCPSDTDCGLETYIAEVNATSFCGGSNWRMPTYNELMGLLDFNLQTSTHLLSSEFFPNTPDPSQLGHLRYWTIETSAEGIGLDFAWALEFQSGNDIAYPKSSTAFIRLVRTP